MLIYTLKNNENIFFFSYSPQTARRNNETVVSPENMASSGDQWHSNVPAPSVQSYTQFQGCGRSSG